MKGRPKTIELGETLSVYVPARLAQYVRNMAWRLKQRERRDISDSEVARKLMMIGIDSLQAAEEYQLEEEAADGMVEQEVAATFSRALMASLNSVA